MPRISKTIVPRIRKSLRDRGLAGTLRRGFLLPLHLMNEYRLAKTLRPGGPASEFDRTYGVDTDGQFGACTFLSDLEIPSPNWIEGYDYVPISPERFRSALASLDIAFEDFTFIDFGSGKGRALLLASEYPFKEVMGLEFSPDLHRIAEDNIARYRSATQKCRNIRSLNADFASFAIPPEPLVLFFFDPCRGRVLADVVARIAESLLSCPRPLYVVYVAPRAEVEQLFAGVQYLKEICRDSEAVFCIYESFGERA